MFPREIWYAQYSLTRGNLLLNVSAANFSSIATGTWYNARVSKSPCEYKNGAVTFNFAELERARDQKELP